VFNMSDPPQGTKKPFNDRTREAPALLRRIFDVVECSLVQRLAQAHLLSLGVF
jgi:hypothetical protein